MPMLYFLCGENHFSFPYDLGVKYALEVHGWCVFVSPACVSASAFQPCFPAQMNCYLFLYHRMTLLWRKPLKMIQTHSMKYAIMSLVSDSPVLDVFSAWRSFRRDMFMYRPAERMRPFFCPNEGNSKDIRVRVFILKHGSLSKQTQMSPSFSSWSVSV